MQQLIAIQNTEMQNAGVQVESRLVKQPSAAHPHYSLQRRQAA